MIIALDRKASECDLMKGTIQLRTPLTGYARGENQPWVMDNGSFSAFDDSKFMRMADVAIGDSNCKWVALPDVVGDHEKTLDRFWEWKRILESHWINKKMKFAFVVQDGATIESIPWDDIVAVFLGGTEVGSIPRSGLSTGIGQLTQSTDRDWPNTTICLKRLNEKFASCPGIRFFIRWRISYEQVISNLHQPGRVHFRDCEEDTEPLGVHARVHPPMVRGTDGQGAYPHDRD